MLEQWWLWGAFFALVLGILWIDIRFVGGGHSHKVSVKEAGVWTLIWVAVAMAFNTGLWFYFNHIGGAELAQRKTVEFLTGYLLEKALAVDNVFVWLMIFSFFAIPAELQRRVLLYGVLGAIILRSIMVFGGAYLVNQFHWVLYVFGVFLVFTGLKMVLVKESEDGLENNAMLGFMRRHMKLTETLKGERFFVVKQGVRYATPLFLVLLLVEFSDVIFAVDSIPAIFAVTTDPFIVLTSNIFAIMGLRAMYFLLAGVAERFALLKYGLAAILVFIGIKMLIIEWYKIPVGVALAVVASILVISMAASLYASRNSRTSVGS
ncbi:MAG: TerC family protein [Shewanella sp.]|nr:TerC family protein [Shewanella sp.]MCF1430587.1 TerC family protein [Shewanella sp.]MCF1438509.1 TerC family protein [Shewanella sp.]MCF1458486.1 TerC family protein [Shewanella sp.]